MPEHTPILCPDCKSPLATTDEKCWNCGREGALDEGREQTAEHAREVAQEAGTAAGRAPTGAGDGAAEARPGLLTRVRARLQKLRS